MNRDSSTGFFSGLMVGALIGLAVGFLYAPKPGEETRHAAREKIQDTRDKVSKKVEEWRNERKNNVKNVTE